LTDHASRKPIRIDDLAALAARVARHASAEDFGLDATVLRARLRSYSERFGVSTWGRSRR